MIRALLLTSMLAASPAMAQEFFLGGQYAPVQVPEVFVSVNGVNLGTYTVPGARPLCQCVVGRPADLDRRVIAVCLATANDQVTVTAFALGLAGLTVPARTWTIRCFNPPVP